MSLSQEAALLAFLVPMEDNMATAHQRARALGFPAPCQTPSPPGATLPCVSRFSQSSDLASPLGRKPPF